MKQKLHSLLLLVVLLSWSIVIAASDFDDGILKYTITSPENLEVKCDGFTDAHKNDESVVIPETVNYNNSTYSVVSISDAFTYCSNLTSLVIPFGVRTIGYGAFFGCRGLTTLNIPSSVTSIGEVAFYDCTGLTSLNLPSSVTSIGKAAFGGCSSLTSLNIPSSLSSISDGAFSNCSGLKSLDVPSSVTSIGKNAFTGCSSLTSLNIPSSVTSIGESAFWGCSSLTSLNIPSSITSIGNSTFRECRGLTSFVIPFGVTSIGEGAFYNCTGLTSLNIPSSITSIGVALVLGCTNLKSITCNSLEAPVFLPSKSNPYPFLCEPDLVAQITLVIPEGAIGYSEEPWKYFKIQQSSNSVQLTDENQIVGQGAYPVGYLSYARSNMEPGSYATFCLPFDTNLSEVSDAFENVYTANQTALYKPDGKLILLLQKIDKDASISAGQPFVAKLKDNVTEVTFSNNKLMTVDSDIMQNGTPTPLHVFDWDGTSGLLTENTDIKVSYGGALSTMSGVGSEYETFNSNGTFGPTKGGQVKAFRAYVLKEDAVTQGRVKSISFGIEGNDGTTNIETIVDSPEKNTDKMVYSIDGRLVNTTGSVVGLPSGIYIKNHQKIYVK